MAIYIKSAEAISPQHTFRVDSVLAEAVAHEKEYLTCLHPDYKTFFNPASLRRMSNVIRMGLATSREALEKASLEQPGAILVGTGLGCVKDTVKFLEQVIGQDEQLLNPTAFIQSTHNTVSGQIALMLGCRNHNLTFSQKGISFETALLEAIMLLGEEKCDNVLIGGVDEITAESYALMVEGGCARPLSVSRTEGAYERAVAGEGATFFVLAGTGSGSALAKIDDLAIVNSCHDPDQASAELDQFLGRNGLRPEDIDMLVSGRSGDAVRSRVYGRIESSFPGSPIAGYKHLVGEYDSAMAFGLFLGSRIIAESRVPELVLMEGAVGRALDRALVFNYTKNLELSFILITKPDS